MKGIADGGRGAMTDTGWPGEARPGVPANPERDGWHWMDSTFSTKRRVYPEHWRAGPGGGWSAMRTSAAPNYWRYLGPCLAPAEVAARIADAEARGRIAGMREAAGIAEERANALCDFGKHVRAAGAEEAAKDIRTKAAAILARVEAAHDPEQ